MGTAGSDQWVVLADLLSVFFVQRLQTGHGEPAPAGAGFFFFWAASLSLSYARFQRVVQSFGKKAAAEEKGSLFGRSNVGKVCCVIISLFVYALLMEQLGFLVVTLLLFLFLLGGSKRGGGFFSALVSLP